MIPYKFIQIPGEFFYLVEKFIKKLKNNLVGEGLLKMAWKFVKYWRKSTWIYRKKQDPRDLINEFDWADKTKQAAFKTLRVWTKNEENFEKLQENFEIFW